MKLCKETVYCRVILLVNVLGWNPLEILKSLHSSGELEHGPVAWLRKRSLSVPWPEEAL